MSKMHAPQPAGYDWIVFDINSIKSLDSFRLRFTVDGQIMPQYKYYTFEFRATLSELLACDAPVEELLFELALIVQRYRVYSRQFRLTCVLPDPRRMKRGSTATAHLTMQQLPHMVAQKRVLYSIRLRFRRKRSSFSRIKLDKEYGREIASLAYKISTYMSIVSEFVSTAAVDASGNKFPIHHNIEHVKRMSPVMEVNQSLLSGLSLPMPKGVLDNWLEKKRIGYKACKNKQMRILYRQCLRLLLGDIDAGKTISSLRRRAFTSESFTERICDIPFISLLIFAMFDFAYREEAADRLKAKIRERLGLRRVKLEKADVLDQIRNVQKREFYNLHEAIKKDGYDNKTIFEYMVMDTDNGKECSDDDKLHQYVIKELYEAITISEGLLQLIENVVQHANPKRGNGKGLFSFYIRNVDKDKAMLQGKYGSYFSTMEHPEKFMLEAVIADLSDTNIPDKFRANNVGFLNEDHSCCPTDVGDPTEVFRDIGLEDFFNPDYGKSQWWRYFFSAPDRVINHYGLQIFNSVIESKGGYFAVQSANHNYSTGSGCGSHNAGHKGTAYTVLLPLDGRTHYDNNIYDSMFSYDLGSYVGKQMKIIRQNCLPKRPDMLDKPRHISEIGSMLPTALKDDEILCFDLSLLAEIHLECLVKATLKMIFAARQKENKLYISFVNCQTYQLIDILRIVALYYDKRGLNQNMGSVEIYICGKNVGEEILIYGKNLETVRHNITQAACMRGLSFEYIGILDKILSDRETRER